jgi:hypothetical protein
MNHDNPFSSTISNSDASSSSFCFPFSGKGGPERQYQISLLSFYEFFSGMIYTSLSVFSAMELFSRSIPFFFLSISTKQTGSAPRGCLDPDNARTAEQIKEFNP